jgi:hypothetical protein
MWPAAESAPSLFAERLPELDDGNPVISRLSDFAAARVAQGLGMAPEAGTDRAKHITYVDLRSGAVTKPCLLPVPLASRTHELIAMEKRDLLYLGAVS